MSFFNEYQQSSPKSRKLKPTILIDTESNDVVITEENEPVRKKVGKVFNSEFKLNAPPIKKIAEVVLKEEKTSFHLLILFVFICGLLLRGVFMDGGLIDYNKSVDFHRSMELKAKEIKLENQEISKKIAQLEQDKVYLKKVVREQLGVIAPDEYILIFSE